MARTQIAKISGVEKSAVENNGVVRFAFADEQKVEFDLKELFGEPDEFTNLPLIAKCLMVHGFRQKGPDAYAGAQDPAEAREKLQAIWTMLTGADGEAPAWTRRAEGGSKVTSIDKLAQAVVNAYAAMEPPIEKDLAETKVKLEAMDKSTRSAIRRSPEVQAALAKLNEGKKSLTDLLPI